MSTWFRFTPNIGRRWRWHRGDTRPNNPMAEHGLYYADCLFGLVAWPEFGEIETSETKPETDCCKRCERIDREEADQ